MGTPISKEAFYCDVSLKDFKIKGVIGNGSFSQVKVVKHKKTDRFYALKIIKKDTTKIHKILRNVITERNLLERIESPFVCNLRYAFQDDSNIFMVLDLATGGDLRYHLSRHKFSEKEAKFICAEVACGLDYIHSQSIIHRDIKPENILLDKFGHSRIVDFNVSIVYDKNDPPKYSVGSLNYMKLEVLKGGFQYDESVDWWSLGIVVYELLLQKRPFKGKNSAELIMSIQKGVNISEDCDRNGVQLTDSCSKFLKSILNQNGNALVKSENYINSLESIKNSEWFANTDWKSIQSCSVQPVFVPRGDYLKHAEATAIKRNIINYGLLYADDRSCALSASVKAQKNLYTNMPVSSKENVFDILMGRDTTPLMLTKGFVSYNYYASKLHTMNKT